MKAYLPFKELTLPENAYDKQLHRSLLEKVNALADAIPPYEVFAEEASARSAEERYGYGGTAYMPYGWYHSSWVWPVLQEKESRGRPIKRKNPLRKLQYVYRYDSAGTVVSIEYHLPKKASRKKARFVTYFDRRDGVMAMYTFSDFSKAEGGMRLYSVAWIDPALSRQHIVKANWHADCFKAERVSTEIIYTLQINGKTYCDSYEYCGLTDHLFKTTIDYELSDLSKL